MGCSHSKVNDIVAEPITAPPSECGKASMDLAFTEIIVDHDESRSSVPANIEEVEEEEEPDTTPATEEEPSETVPEEPTVQAEVVDQQPAVEEEAPVEEEPVEPESEADEEVEVEVQLEKSAVTEKSAVVEKSAVTDKSAVLTFTADKVSFTVGIAFFNIIGSTGEEEIYLTKRYSEFKVLHAEMAKLMTKEELPGMPGTSFLQGRNDRALLNERETAFVKMLNAIAQHPEASQSAPFVAFLA